MHRSRWVRPPPSSSGGGLVASVAWMTVDTTIVVAAIAALGAGIGAVYLDLRRDRDYWRDATMGLLNVTDRATTVSEKVVRRRG